MKMRAKMIDGTPVTFESHDWGGVRYRETGTGKEGTCGPYRTDFIGEGLYVRSECGSQDRFEADRQALERSGVDTATVEYLDRLATVVPLSEEWLPLWPKQDEWMRSQDERNAALLRDIGSPSLLCRGPPTEAMIAAGGAALHDGLTTHLTIEGGRVYAGDYGAIVRAIYVAMERARR